MGQPKLFYVDQVATPHINDKRDVMLGSQVSELAFRHRFGEAFDAVVTGMHAH